LPRCSATSSRLRFKGGKAVATTLGAFMALSWPVGIAACATWLATAALFRISSLAGLAAVAVAPAAAWWFSDSPMAAAATAIGLAVVWRHQANIARIFAGTEPRIGGGR
jgi:glycerol-3-phosphate acyltransferase PlsY